MALFIGDYQVTLKKPGYLEAMENVSLAEGDAKTLRIMMQTYAGSRLQKRKIWKRRKWINLATGAICLSAGYYCNLLGGQYYQDYQNADTDDQAKEAWQNTEACYNYRDISYSVSVVPIAVGFYSWIKQIHYRK